MGVRLGAMGTPWGRFGVPRGEEGGGTRHPRETQRRRNGKTHELDERCEGAMHDHRSTAAFESRRRAHRGANGGRREEGRGTQGIPKEEKTHELDERGEGTTHDHRSTAAFESRRKNIAKQLCF